MSPAAIRDFLSGRNLVLQTIIPHHIAKKYPSEVMVLQHQYDKALKGFNSRVKKLQKVKKKQEDKLENPENREAILFKMNRDKEERRWH